MSYYDIVMNKGRVQTYNKNILYERASNYDLSSFKGKIIGAPSHWQHPNKYSPESIFKQYPDGVDKKSFVQVFSEQSNETNVPKEKFLTSKQLEQLYDILDVNEDGKMDLKEFCSFSRLGHQSRSEGDSIDYKDLDDLINGSEKYKSNNSNEHITPPKADGKPVTFKPGEKPQIC